MSRARKLLRRLRVLALCGGLASPPGLAALALCGGATLLLAGCEGEELKEVERQEIDRVFKTGTAFEGDPFVRAETLRILELLADPRLDPYALACRDDDSDMVKVAALRVLLATRNGEAERATLALYTRTKTPVREALLSAAEEYGSQELKQELYQQAMRSKEEKLRLMGFEQGALAEFKRAQREKDEEALKVELIPQFSQLVDSDDEVIAAGALRKMVEIGRGDRATPLLERFQNTSLPVEQRVRLARLLRMAGVEQAKSPFLALVQEAIAEDDVSDKKKLKLPVKVTDPQLLRAAVLGAVALGDATHVVRAQEYLKNAKKDDVMEVLEALAQNPSEEAGVSLKIAMLDARPQVRYLAIERYGERGDATAKALINALRQDDPRARRLLANVLVVRFPEQWSQELKLQLQAPETRLVVLRLLRDVIDPSRDLKVLEPLREVLVGLASSDEGEVSSMAAYLLLLSAPDNQEYLTLVENQSNMQTRYVFMEHLIKTRPRQSIAIFRKYFYDDLFALRLMSAAGLWAAFEESSGAPAAKPAASPVASTEGDDKG